MADFVTYYQGGLLYDDLSRHTGGMGSTGTTAAFNTQNNIIYYGTTIYTTLYGRNVVTKSLVYTKTGVTMNTMPMFVDPDGYVWCLVYASKTIRKFAPDLNSYETYTLATTEINGVHDLAVTFDFQYMYVICNYATQNKILKYSLENIISGGDPEWVAETNYPQFVFVDSDGNAYCQNWVYTPGNSMLRKHDKTDGSVLFAVYSGNAYHEGFYSAKTNKIYIPYIRGGVNKWKEKTTDGEDDGLSTVPTSTTPCSIIADSRENYLYGGGASGGTYKFNCSNWSDSEAPVATSANTLGYVRGDPSGYSNYNLLSIPTPSVENRVFKLTRGDIVVKTKPFIEEMSLFTEDKYNGKLRITDSDIIITNTEGTPLGTLLVEKDLDFRVTPYLTTQRVDVAETDFELTEDGNNLYIKPKTTTKQLKAETENIILNQNVWR